jgi:hypothetical protein
LISREFLECRIVKILIKIIISRNRTRIFQQIIKFHGIPGNS